MKKLLLLSILVGLIYVLSFPPIDIWICGWILLAPAMLLAEKMREEKLKRQLLLSFLPAFIYAVGGFYWIGYVATTFGRLPWIAAIFVVLGFASFAGLHMTFFLLLTSKLLKYKEKFEKKFTEKNKLLRVISNEPIVFAILFTSLDFLYPKIFPETLGHSQHSKLYINQIADIFGMHVITFIISYCGTTLYFLAKKQKNAIKDLALLLIIVIAANIYGIKAIKKEEAKAKDSLKIAIIQANIGDADKYLAEQGDQATIDNISREYRTFTANLLGKKLDLIIWPETAYPRLPKEPDFGQKRSVPYEIASVAIDHKAYLFTGSYDYAYRETKSGPRQTIYNASLFVSPNGELLANYRKSLLLAFGEYFPGAEYLPFLNDLIPTIGDFGRGQGPSVIEMKVPAEGTNRKSYLFSPLICYEVLTPSFVREAVNQGAHFILNITNDSWFGPYSEPYQHLALSKFRAIENRKLIVRATNTGFSTLISPTGEVTFQSNLFKKEIIEKEIQFASNPEQTIYGKYGDFFPYTLVFISILLSLIVSVKIILLRRK